MRKATVFAALAGLCVAAAAQTSHATARQTLAWQGMPLDVLLYTQCWKVENGPSGNLGVMFQNTIACQAPTEGRWIVPLVVDTPTSTSLIVQASCSNTNPHTRLMITDISGIPSLASGPIQCGTTAFNGGIIRDWYAVHVEFTIHNGESARGVHYYW